METETLHPGYTLKQLIFYFLKLGYAGFGGPVRTKKMDLR